ncbi:basic proline-rich protein-like [Melospiza georgiana]|uniref:basic proline-rich protein-like n=1 Tax=Melospiza georgiana TaxID=44398 RepID=UPI0025AD987D|nr:basic proline-rich protein-like [Melospiza georgiana]
MTKHNQLPRDVAESSSLEISTSNQDKVLGNGSRALPQRGDSVLGQAEPRSAPRHSRTPRPEPRELLLGNKAVTRLYRMTSFSPSSTQSPALQNPAPGPAEGPPGQVPPEARPPRPRGTAPPPRALPGTAHRVPAGLELMPREEEKEEEEEEEEEAPPLPLRLRPHPYYPITAPPGRASPSSRSPLRSGPPVPTALPNLLEPGEGGGDGAHEPPRTPNGQPIPAAAQSCPAPPGPARRGPAGPTSAPSAAAAAAPTVRGSSAPSGCLWGHAPRARLSRADWCSGRGRARGGASREAAWPMGDEAPRPDPAYSPPPPRAGV